MAVATKYVLIKAVPMSVNVNQVLFSAVTQEHVQVWFNFDKKKQDLNI